MKDVMIREARSGGQPATRKNMARFGVAVDNRVLEKLDERAEKLNVSRAQLINTMLDLAVSEEFETGGEVTFSAGHCGHWKVQITADTGFPRTKVEFDTTEQHQIVDAVGMEVGGRSDVTEGEIEGWSFIGIRFHDGQSGETRVYELRPSSENHDGLAMSGPLDDNNPMFFIRGPFEVWTEHTSPVAAERAWRLLRDKVKSRRLVRGLK